ncbi:winged helix-turn-helix transcriptional regulator [Methanolacinia petrolearia]|uniref:winged helix-turn-helix transcriptional regulator n=1 Tax=Methanolacinia petrolearia TaxID=54120 RepID=UPI003BAA80D3
MQNVSKLILFFYILLIFMVTGVQAAEGDYIIKPHEDNQDLIDKGLIDSGGADSTITFWELPLLIKISFIAGILAAIIGTIKIIPIIQGRLEDLFDNQNRNDIFDFISENPGCSIADISNNLGINRGSTKYHIGKLISDSKVTLVKSGKFIRIFENSGIFDEQQKVLASHLRNETGRKLLLSIMENPGITNMDLAEKHDMNKSTIHWHLKKFQKSGIVQSSPEGRYKKYSLNPTFENDLKDYFSK